MNNLGEGVRLLDSIHETWTHTITTTITIIRKQKKTGTHWVTVFVKGSGEKPSHGME